MTERPEKIIKIVVNKIFTIAVLVIVCVVVMLGSAKNVQAAEGDYCGQIRIDRYKCNNPPVKGSCGPAVLDKAGEWLNCYIVHSGQCRSQFYCSSNDTCNNIVGSCDCSNSDAPCGVSGPTCSDGIQNQEETGVDCGGPCAACGDGGGGGGGGGSGSCDKECSSNADCASDLSCQSRGGKDVCWGNPCEPIQPPPTICQGQSKPGNCCEAACHDDRWGTTCDQQHYDWGTCYCGPGVTPFVGCLYGDPGWECHACPTPTPPPCTPPAVPVLQSPSPGATIPSTTATLSWTESNWGTCNPAGQERFKIYVQECSSLITPTTEIPGLRDTYNYDFTGVSGTSYCWTVAARKVPGSLTAQAFPRRFTLTAGGTPWWQVSGGGVMAVGGITSNVYSGQTLIKNAPAVVAANGSISLNGAKASSTDWQAKDAVGVISNVLNYRYDYESVYSRVYATIKPVEFPTGLTLVNPSQVTGPGISYVHVTGDLDVNADLNFGSNKVVILVEGNANLKGKINFTDNVGLFALYVKGNINIDPTVGTDTGTGVDPDTLTANLEGIFLANGSFNTGTGTRQLKIEGPVIGIGGVNFQRQLNSQWPNEYIVFRPDILMNLPKPLLRQNNLWMEGNP